MHRIKTGLAHGFGKAWAAIDNENHVLKIIKMASVYRRISKEDAKRFTRKLRWCKTAKEYQKNKQDKSFQEGREKARSELSKLGSVVSGIVNDGEFIF